MTEHDLNTQEGFNYCIISGVLEGEFEYSHMTAGVRIFKNTISVTRNSGIADHLPINVPESLISSSSVLGKFVELRGNIRSVCIMDVKGRKHLNNYLYPYYLNIYEKESELQECMNSNYIYLKGYIDKIPVLRTTPFGKVITDFMITVNRKGNSNRSDHIPCIAWGKAAEWVSKLELGDPINILGRFQSRVYFKRENQNDEKGEYKTAYEVSVMTINNFENH